ncbi:curli production assembly/transport component CsgF [Gillisia sp. Hel_I_86]|uniref:curli production assembly/transport component CsgF n=1 Tax=Gillisia sp. Hel_I_86 TaxID=1249981 RepID=UPI00119AD3BF|nr:curli production assembly/transport component CsgF [Gillisia sp. Hel_I_86]TVZ25661.1 curli production assembly/transport component CsgF [Gillisia sp. Hel_I_86]
MKKITLIIFLFLSFNSFSQDLVYKPINPAFGGDTFNYQWMLSSAQAQNSFTDDAARENFDRSELEDFTQSLNSQLLGQVSRRLFTTQFGELTLQPGTYSFGSLALDIYTSNEGLVINILDTNTGEQTQIVIPNS